jgi:putative redox protein
MTVRLQRKPDASLAQTVAVGDHAWVADVSAEEGGNDDGPSPHDLYDAALGACKALTVMWFARKKGIAVDDVQTKIVRDDADERKGVYRLKAEMSISGSFTDAEFAQLAAVAEKCPVHKLMTSVTTEITTSLQRAA